MRGSPAPLVQEAVRFILPLPSQHPDCGAVDVMAAYEGVAGIMKIQLIFLLS